MTRKSFPFKEYPIAFLGAIEAGLVVTTLNPAYTPTEASKQLADSEPKLIICTVDNYEVVKQSCALANNNAIKFVVIKTSNEQSISMDAINFEELIDPTGS